MGNPDNEGAKIRRDAKKESVATVRYALRRMAEDLTNGLTGIPGYIEIVEMNFKEGDQGLSDCKMLRKATKQVLSIVGGSYTTFLNRTDVNARTFDLADEVRKALDEYKEVKDKSDERYIPEDIHISAEYQADSCPAIADSVDYIVLQLTKNAKEAKASNIKITVGMRDITEHPAMVPGRYAFIQVFDNGKGMDTQTKKKAAFPFFSTRDRTKGRGLGLTTVDSIATLCDGCMDIESEPGKGSTFIVYFPHAKP